MSETPSTYHVVGLMSGSSLDGIDLSYCSYSTSGDAFDWELLNHATYPIPDTWKSRLLHLPEQSAKTFVKTHTYFGHFLSEVINDFIERQKITPDFIASHGHTIFHEPNKRFTTQIGCGAAIATQTGLPVINDFRIQDISINGEGTPLAPAADLFLFEGYDFYLNLGGIANLTAKTVDQLVAFDVCPANQLLNFLANQINLAYDKDGILAKSGQLLPALMERLRDFEYYRMSYPKSLDNSWIKKEVLSIFQQFEEPVQDKLHTTCKFIAEEITNSLSTVIQSLKMGKNNHYKLLATGGGTFNEFLLECIVESNTKGNLPIEVVLPEKEIIDFKEAILMGLLGVLRVQNRPNCFASVTGAKYDTIGGIVHQGTTKFI